MLAGLIILVAGMGSIGAWVGQQIEDGVVHRTAATTALYVDSFIAPNVQELAQNAWLTPAHRQNLNVLLGDTAFGHRIAAFKVWTKAGRIVYSTDAALIGKTYPVQGGLARSLQGEVAARISDLSDAENVRERARDSELLEMYSPVRRGGTDEVIGAAEFYYTVDDMAGEIAAAQWRSWLLVALATLLMYLLLYGFIRGASQTINRQQRALEEQVQRLTTLLDQNETLHERVRRAAARTTALNERFLRRIGAELHDGPAQDLGLALLRLDQVAGPGVPGPAARGNGTAPPEGGDLAVVEGALRRAMQEVRAISGGLGLPDMESWPLAETVRRVVRSHERRTGTHVAVDITCAAEQASLPVKITLYRVIQEALNNAYRHAGGRGQQVSLRSDGSELQVEVADSGPGFAAAPLDESETHLGLIGMRERVESLGGRFTVESSPEHGTRVRATLSLAARDADGA